MSLARVIVPAACFALILVGGVLWMRAPQGPLGPGQSAPKALSSAATPVVSGQPSRMIPSPTAMPVDVYFLSEGSAAASGKRTPTMRQPTVNGTRRIANAKPVTDAGAGPFVAPRFSPDGLELLFSKPGYNGLYTMGADGGAVTQVSGREGIGFRAKWTPEGTVETRGNDGENQVLKSDGTPMDAAAYESDASIVGAYTKDDAVYLRRAPGEAPVVVTPPDGADRYYGGVLSPDGKSIAYNGLHTGLYVQSLAGGPAVHLGEGYSPQWLPDGSGVVYNISVDDGHNLLGSDLFLSSPDGTTVSNLTGGAAGIPLNPSISPDGSRLAYETEGRLFVADLR